MKIMTTYKVKLHTSQKAFADTVKVYRQAVNFFITVALEEWDTLHTIPIPLERQQAVERLSHKTKNHPFPQYPFDAKFYKFPSYLRRAAISEAIGKVSSYHSNLANWNASKHGAKPGIPKAGFVCPAMYKDNCFVRTGTYTARLKVWIHNTWDWVNIRFKKTDIDYILHHCQTRRECVPTLRRRGKNWYLDFAFEERVLLDDTPIDQQIALGVDLGINNACACSAMCSDGTILGRKILSLPREQDYLNHQLNKIKKAQQHGSDKNPRLWAKLKGINQHITEVTAQFIVDTAVLYGVTTIVFEHLDLQGKKKGSKRQRLHHWKAQAVQAIVADKAHRLGMHIRRVCAWNTSRLAFDGSGRVERDSANYSLCTFPNGKRYHCDLSASYNIVARYFVREIYKSLPETVRLDISAKVPECTKRTTCTFSTLLSFDAGLKQLYAPVSES